MFKASSPGFLSSISGISEDEDEDEKDDNLEVLITPWKELPVLQQFNCWLVSPDAKGKGTRQARQHVQQVEIMLQESSQGSFHMENLFDRKNICDNWLLYFEQARKLGTVKSYIHSLRCFYKFVLCDDPKECTPFASK